MALTPQNSDAFFREVDEEVRRDQFIGFWARYGRTVIAAIVAALAGLGGWLWWQHSQAQSAGADGEALTAVIQQVGTGKAAEAKPGLDMLVMSSRDGYRAAAKLVQAAGALETNDMKAAAAAYGAIAADASLPQPFRDLARVRQTTLEFDALPPAQVIARLKPLVAAGNPWLGSAGELVAAAQIKAGDRRAAAATFGLVAGDEGVPQTVRARAARLASGFTAAPVAASAPAAAVAE